MTYYNDNDKFCCNWLRNLTTAELLPPGYVDERSIRDVQATDLANYAQCHFFAGIGGWPYALRLAGWPDDLPVWTGSCPCQPFSVAGRRLGESDDRHLWPELRRLITAHRPAIVFGEQVASAAGKVWLSGVREDMGALGYAFGAAGLPAGAVEAKHIRLRLFFVAYTRSTGLEGLHKAIGGKYLQPAGQDIPRHDWKATPRVLQRINGFSRKLDRPLAYREQIQGYGNAIVPQVAAEFIRAFMESVGLLNNP